VPAHETHDVFRKELLNAANIERSPACMVKRSMRAEWELTGVKMTYEKYPDEVTNLLTALCDRSDGDAVKHVMRPGSGFLYAAR
jgi:hypothetical protein